MKPKTYNTLLVVTYIIGAVILASVLYGFALDYDIRSMEKRTLLGLHILTFIGAALFWLVHYAAMLWGSLQGLLYKKSAIILFGIETWMFFYFILLTICDPTAWIRALIGIFAEPERVIQNISNLILYVICWLIPLLRIIFTVYVLKKKKDDAGGKEEASF